MLVCSTYVLHAGAAILLLPLAVAYLCHLARKECRVQNSNLALIESLPSTTPTKAQAETECSICFDHLTTAVSELQCGHVFHRVCIQYWLHLQPTCPLCKQVVNLRQITT